ncbi:glycosyltransferase [Myxococcus sp. AB025B]|uniref:glycosyltransferase n=1 Tax=Myxococcus sp. AB025B TaxID=2562794 RepID=UPI001E55B287|nr:glycosyltransferase [Myxococcus sp. AB025B]
MRICLVRRALPVSPAEGIGHPALSMSRALAASGHEVHLLTAPHPALEQTRALLPGVHLHTVPSELTPGFAGAFPFPPLRHSMAVYLALRELHASHPFDVIEFPEYEGEGYFSLRARRTLGHFASAVLAVRLHGPTHEARALNRVATMDMDAAQLEHLEDTSIREADLLLSPTRALLAQVSTRLKLDTRGVVVPPPFVVRSDTSPTRRTQTPRPRVVYAGRLECRAGLHLLIEAMQSLFERGVDAELRLIGDDTETGPFGRSLRGWLERQVAPAWHERIHFDSALPDAELATAFAATTVCCVPAPSGPVPEACLEAMSSGVLVVGDDASGLADLLEDGRSGLLFRSGDVGHLAATLEKALTLPELRQTAQREAPLRVADVHAPSRVVKQWETAVEGVAHVRNHVLPRPARERSDTPRVSVLLPYFNMGRYLPETLRSIRAQTFTDYEILLVDDGSTDPESIELLDRVQAPDLRIIRKQNGGLSSARNAGLKAARGHYILPLDPDDLIAPTFLEKCLTVLEGTPGLGYVTSLVTYFVEDATHVTGGWAPWGVERDALWVANVASTCTALMRRSHLEEVGGYDEWLTGFEDWDVFCSLAERGLGGSVIPEPLFQYRLRQDSMTRTSMVGDRPALMAYLRQKHPRLALHPERSLCILQGEALKLESLALARAAEAAPRPLLDKVVDRVNGTLKRLDFVHHALRGVATRVVGTEDSSRPLRQQLVDRLRGRR